MPEHVNPFDALLTLCNDDPDAIQQAYQKHRSSWAEKQRAALLATDGRRPLVQTDEILRQIIDNQAKRLFALPSSNATSRTPYPDWRHNLTLWIRPPQRVCQLITTIQQSLAAAIHDVLRIDRSSSAQASGVEQSCIWYAPSGSIHVTALEIASGRSASEIEALVSQLQPAVFELADFPRTVSLESQGLRRVGLCRPQITFDAHAVALSFLPAARIKSGAEVAPITAAQSHAPLYSYHHLRRDLYGVASRHVTVGGRYVVPSAHATIARFVDGDSITRDVLHALIDRIDSINQWLALAMEDKETGFERIHAKHKTEAVMRHGAKAGLSVTSENVGKLCNAGFWTVGEETGLELRAGTCWYGDGGETVRMGGPLSLCKTAR